MVGGICICGGGHIAHSLAAVFSSGGEQVVVFTRRPELWGDSLHCEQGAGRKILRPSTKLHATSNVSAVRDAECVIIALPRFAIADEMAKIAPAIHAGQTIVFIPAPAGLEERLDGFAQRGVDVIGFQRVPFISRIIEYGHSVMISDDRSEHRLAFSNDASMDKWRNFFEKHFGGRVSRLSSFWSFTFSNSNPLLHPARLVTLLHGGDKGMYQHCPLFYAEWTDEASALYIAADEEMRRCFLLYDKRGASTDYESVLKHYESENERELTGKIRSIEAFRRILAPWKQGQDGLWGPDRESRYFTEDIPFGTMIIQQYARKANIATPTIDRFVRLIDE